jgi:hypothetical protein
MERRGGRKGVEVEATAGDSEIQVRKLAFPQSTGDYFGGIWNDREGNDKGNIMFACAAAFSREHVHPSLSLSGFLDGLGDLLNPMK